MRKLSDDARALVTWPRDFQVDRLSEIADALDAAEKALEAHKRHMEGMQAAMARYVRPRMVFETVTEAEFARGMVRFLDGPEQRAIDAETEDALAKIRGGGDE